MAIFKTIKGTEREQADCCKNMGAALNDLKKCQDAIRVLEQALAMYGTIPNIERERAGCLALLGDALRNAGRHADAIPRYQQATEHYATIPGTEREQAWCQGTMAASLDELGRLDEAIQHYQRGVALSKGVKGAERFQAGCFKNLGLVLDRLCRYDQAIEQYQQTLTVYKTVPGSEWQQADVYRDIGVSLLKLGKYEEAIQRAERALAMFRAIKGAEAEQANCCQTIGVALRNMGRYDDAIQRQAQALAILATLRGTELDQAGCYQNMSVIKLNMNKFDEAMQYQERALNIFKSLPGTALEQGNCHQNLGIALAHTGRYEEAVRQQQHALASYAAIRGAERPRGACHENIGSILALTGQYEEAIQQQEQALALFRAIRGAEREQADCYVNIGVALRDMGRDEQDLQRQEQALAIYTTIKGTEREQATCYLNSGVALCDLGRYEEGLGRYRKALAIYQAIPGTELDQAKCYGNIGTILNEIGRYDEAIGQQHEAISIFNKLQGSDHLLPACFGNLGDAHRAAGDFGEAIVDYHVAGPSWWICRGAALAYFQRRQPGDEDKAAAQFVEAVRYAEASRSAVVARENRTGIFVRTGQVFPDFVGFLATVEISQRRIATPGPALLGWATVPESESVPLAAAFHYADQGKGRALEDTLREKSLLRSTKPDFRLLAEDRSLSLRISKLTALRETAPAADAQQRSELRRECDLLQQRRDMIEVELKKTSLGDYVAPHFRKPMEMARDLAPDTAVLQYSLGAHDGWLLLLTGDGVTAHQLGAEVPALPELLPRQLATRAQLAEAWKSRPAKIGVDGLVQLARARAEDLGRHPRERNQSFDALQEQAVLERLAAVVLPNRALMELRRKKIQRLLIIPDGSLHYLPFAMLRPRTGTANDTCYLVEEFTTSYVPAMTTLYTIRDQARQRKAARSMGRRPLLAFANPAYGTEVATLPLSKDDMLTRGRAFRAEYYQSGGLRLTSLPETEREATRAASCFAPPHLFREMTADVPEGDALVFAGQGASEEQVKRLLASSDQRRVAPHWQYLLFSAHGQADTYNGMLSCVALSAPSPDSSEDGYLQAQEVLGLDLDTDLVVLSACETGIGRLRGGEGLVGLSAAFFYAGAESVCASLWQVPSGATSQLVPELFRTLQSGKLGRAEALRQAQLAVLKTGRDLEGRSTDYSSPFCWAAFVLIGEYR